MTGKLYELSMRNIKHKKVAVVSNCVPQYRIPIYNILSRSHLNDYTIITGTVMNIKLKLADENLALVAPAMGGIKWVQVKNIWLFNRFLWQKGLLKNLKNSDYDTLIMLGTMYYLSTWVAAIKGRMRGKKIIFWTHGFIRDEKNIVGLIRTTFYKLAHEFLVYGQRGKDIMISKGFDPDKITIVYNSLDYDSQVKIREKDRPTPPVIPFKNAELPVIGYIGRLLKQKKLDILIETVKHLRDNRVLCNTIIIGEGVYMENLKSLVVNYQLEDYFHFYGPCYDESRIFELFSQTCVVVSPGEIGLTAIHAMTYGLPVITHNKFDKQGPEYACIIPGTTGDFFDYYNPVESLSQTLMKWFARTDRIFIKEECYRVIDEFYNPYNQEKIVDSVI